MMNITKRDMDVLNALWGSSESLTASQLTTEIPSITINTVQAVLRKLLKLKLIKVDNIVYSGTVLCRSYLPAVTIEEFAIEKLTNDYKSFKSSISKTGLLTSLIKTETNPAKALQELDELEKMITEYKKKLKK